MYECECSHSTDMSKNNVPIAQGETDKTLGHNILHFGYKINMKTRVYCKYSKTASRLIYLWRRRAMWALQR